MSFTTQHVFSLSGMRPPSPHSARIIEIDLTLLIKDLLACLISKLYAKYIYLKILGWIQSEIVLAEEQAGFRRDHSSLGHEFHPAVFS